MRWRGLRYPALQGLGRLHNVPSHHLQLSRRPQLRLFSAEAQAERLPTTEVSSPEQAYEAVKVLMSRPDVKWACDTEVSGIDVKEQSPVGNGKVICVSIYGGEDIDFGNGSTLWIDNSGKADGVLQIFKEWFESDEYQKVWHNYGFDRHVMENEGIRCGGFAGDTMHMARLWDTSRDKLTGGGEGYSLSALTSTFFQDRDPRFVKVSMIDLFGKHKLKKDGTESKIKELPDLLELQHDPIHRPRWIDYSARDAAATWHVMKELEKQLKMMPWVVNNRVLGNMLDFYSRYVAPFGQLLTDMEANGIRVDTQGHLKDAEFRAREERQRMEKLFLDWAKDYCSSADFINIASTAQIQQLLFGHYEGEQLISMERSFKIEKSEAEYAAQQQEVLNANPYALLGAAELKNLLRERGLKLTGTKLELQERLMDYDKYLEELVSLGYDELAEKCISRGIHFGEEAAEELARKFLASELVLNKKTLRREPSEGKKEERTEGGTDLRKYREITIRSVGLTPKVFTPQGQPQVSAALLKKLAGKDVFGDPAEAKWGEAFESFGGGTAGVRACRAIGALAAVGQVDATINNFLVPLQALVDKNNRIHCSLNLNTETGRLSSRKPNLQNQPALEKDQYKIRDAFIAEEGKTLIVADYGQLELRVLAHITNCKSMIEAFVQGGCFHSRTAMGMFDYIRDAVTSGKVMLEWDYSKGQPTVPLVKDTYASERRKAKTLNFSIAYGKTVHGLAQDWGISKEEAQKTLDAWYSDRPEVKEWQLRTQELARRGGYVRTMMGRYRRLPDAAATGPSAGHAMRAAINTPIQGSAADIVMMAMLKLWRSEKLKSLGWKLLLQIHDEVILEGPKDSRDEALQEVRACMENPFDGFGLPPMRGKSVRWPQSFSCCRFCCYLS